MIIVIAQVLVDLIVYYYLNYVEKAQMIEKEYNELNKQIELKNLYYCGLKNSYEESRKIIHDFKNYLQVLEYSYENDIENAKLLQKQIIQKFDSRKIRYETSSKILDIILYDKDNEAKEKYIEFNFQMEIIDLNFISEVDIVTIFGNLYDNAIEANENVEESKFINTSIYLVNKMLIIRVENSCNNQLKYDGDKLESTKKDHFGLGTQNIEKSIKKYNGIFTIKTLGKKCIVVISLPYKK